MIEMPSCCTETVVKKARKAHVCCECKKPIQKGSSYQKISGVWDGSAATYKTCMGCAKRRDKATAWVDGNRWLNCEEYPPLGSLDYWLDEYELDFSDGEIHEVHV